MNLETFNPAHLMRRPSRSGAASSTARPFQQHATGVGSPAASRAAPDKQASTEMTGAAHRAVCQPHAQVDT